MRIECSYKKLVEVSALKEHPSNRNKHPEKQIKALAKIIAKVGQRTPIVVSNQSGFIVKGHGRLGAIKLLGWDKCAVDYQDYKDELEELNDRIADNEISRYSEFDQTGFLDDLKTLDLNLDKLDYEEFGKLDFNFTNIIGDLAPVEKPEKEDNEKYIIEVQFPNEMEMMDIYDDLVSRGYIAKIKQGAR